MEVLTHCHFGLMAVTACSSFWLWKLPWTPCLWTSLICVCLPDCHSWRASIAHKLVIIDDPLWDFFFFFYSHLQILFMRAHTEPKYYLSRSWNHTCRLKSLVLSMLLNISLKNCLVFSYQSHFKINKKINRFLTIAFNFVSLKFI